MEDASPNRTKQSILSGLSLQSNTLIKVMNQTYIHLVLFLVYPIFIVLINIIIIWFEFHLLLIPSVHLLVNEPSNKELYRSGVCKLLSTGQSHLLLAFVNKVDGKQPCPFIHLWLLSSYKGSAKQLWQRPYSLQSLKQAFTEKRLLTHSLWNVWAIST